MSITSEELISHIFAGKSWYDTNMTKPVGTPAKAAEKEKKKLEKAAAKTKKQSPLVDPAAEDHSGTEDEKTPEKPEVVDITDPPNPNPAHTTPEKTSVADKAIAFMKSYAAWEAWKLAHPEEAAAAGSSSSSGEPKKADVETPVQEKVTSEKVTSKKAKKKPKGFVIPKTSTSKKRKAPDSDEEEEEEGGGRYKRRITVTTPFVEPSKPHLTVNQTQAKTPMKIQKMNVLQKN